LANTDYPFGFVPYNHGFGGTPGRGSEYRIASGLGSNIFTGDLVKSTGTGKNITVCAAGDTTVGVFNGCQYVAVDGSIVYAHYWPTGTTVKSGTEVIAWVYDDPAMFFTVQASGAFAAGDIGSLSDITAGAGDTATGRSRFELDSTQIAQAGAEQLKIIDIVRDGSNEVGANAKLVVMLNEHELKAKVAAV
jgi:hypothetical protein